MNTSEMTRTQEPRRSGRLRCDNVTTTLGAVCNLSARGACVRGRKVGQLRQGVAVTLDINTDFGKASIRARVIRVRKVGWMKYEAGLEFTETSEWAKAVLGQVAYACPAEGHQLFHSMRRAG